MVVAACSPHLHEKTFRRACANADLNPYLCQMTNIREHCSWVCTDKAAATVKAKAMVYAAAERVKQQQPLEPMSVKVNPATLVVGGGIAGLQATLELADAGHHVVPGRTEPQHRRPHGPVRQDLPHAGLLGLHPHAQDVRGRPARERHPADLLGVGGGQRVGGQLPREDPQEGPLRQRELCNGCGICVEKCPKKVVDHDFEAGLGNRKAIYTPFPQAVPRIPVIDTAACIWFERGKCRACEKLCPTNAIAFDQKDEIVELDVGNIILATGWKLFDCRKLPQYGYGRLPNVYTNMEFERLCNAAGPTNGKIVLRDGKTEPKAVAIIHCVGSRDVRHNESCSAVCCMAALKFGHLVLEKTHAEVYSFYIDMRTNQKGYEEFYQRLLHEGMHFVRGKVAEVSDAPRRSNEAGQARHPGRRHAAWAGSSGSRWTW